MGWGRPQWEVMIPTTQRDEVVEGVRLLRVRGRSRSGSRVVGSVIRRCRSRGSKGNRRGRRRRGIAVVV